ncbi:hypothetical protein C8R44DRAFT_838071 [Mycena epipterygia]|nr:hypothetical protein C8R44DRAFT_838071 [Mycena epipterygia]
MSPNRSWLLLAAFTAYFSASSAVTTCKCLAGAACFPNAAELAAFSATLSHPLISGQRPPASVCYSDSPDFNTAACSLIQANDGNAVFLAERINAVQYGNFQSIINSTTIEECSYTVVPGATCQQGRVPPYAVNATTVSDIQKTIVFATKHNLRLVVRNTGHELMGRSFGVGALELFTHHLDDIEFSNKFIPVGAPKNTAGEFVVTMGSGVQWGTVYAMADQHNRSIAGGFSPEGTVGAAGGWLLGGGHSVLSPFYGLGVDNVLQFSVVLPNASFIIANQYQNTDIFWALRGGGGPSFGVVVSATVRTHPNLPYTVVFYTATGNSTSAYHQLLELWMQNHNPMSDAGWSGVWPFFDNTLFMTFFTQGVPATRTANETMERFFADSRKIPGVNVSLSLVHPYKSFEEFNQDNLVDSSKGFGFNFTAVAPGAPRMVISSWILPRNLTSPDNATMLADLFVNLPDGGNPYMVGGGAVAQIDPDSAAVTPAWRTAITEIEVLPSFSDPPTTDIRVIQQEAFNSIQPFRELAPPPFGGQYLNEADILEVEWQQAYWGDHYPRLLAIKKAIDPHDLLLVQKGVNSEQWDDQITCKTT